MKSGERFTSGTSALTIPVLGLINVLCFDVTVGAVLSGMFAARLLGSAFTLPYWIVLALSVWVVYTLDHLVDAHRLKEKAHTRRHLFIYRNMRMIRLSVVLVALLDLVLVVVYLDRKVLYFGSAAGIITLLYFGMIHLMAGRNEFFIQKEITVSLIYTAGVWGMPLLTGTAAYEGWKPLMIIPFVLLAFTNTMVLSLYDLSTDEADHHPSLAIRLGTGLVKRLIAGLGSVAVLFCLAALYFHVTGPVFVAPYLMMATAMVVLMLTMHRISNRILFRTMTELVFWIPGLVIVPRLIGI